MPTTYVSPPPRPVKKTADKLLAKLDHKQTREVYKSFLGALAFAHFVIAAATGGGVVGYVRSWIAIGKFLIGHPAAALAFPAALYALWKGIVLWRDAEPETAPLPDYPPLPDLRLEDALYIGSAWTRDGKGPGDLWSRIDDSEDDFLADAPHVVLTEKSLHANVHCLGGVGGGKTSTLILPALAQAIGKYPMPPHPDTFVLGRDGRYEAAGAAPPSPLRRVQQRLPRLHLASPGAAAPAAIGAGRDGTATPGPWNPYVGATREEALAEYARLTDLHTRKKWGIFIIDPKGDLTEDVQRMCAVHGRAEDLIVLRPDGPYTYNPLSLSSNSLVMANFVIEGIEAVTGQAINQYYKQTMSEWLANALEILRVVDPTRVNFKSLLRMARNETLRSALVAEADAIMRAAQEEEERLRRIGQVYTGVRVNPAAIEFFKDWDDVDSDPQRKQAVVSGIKSQSQYFVDSEMAPFLCPEMPATFGGFEEMIDRGKIVVLQCPLDRYGPVGKVLGILVMADAQQAARARLNKPMNRDRTLLFCVDEVANFLNSQTKDFVSMSRQSKVCFMAAHQSIGQLAERGKAYEQSFNDNLRTKISYNSPNAEAARRLVSLFGGRPVFKEQWSESQSFAGVENLPNNEAYAAHGTQSAGRSMTYVEREQPWFEPQDLVSLNLGELIIMEFTGTTTLPPRKIKAPAYHLSPLKKLAEQVTVEPLVQKPHPVVLVRDFEDVPESRDHEYLFSACDQTGYIILEPLFDMPGDLQGWKVVTDVGTLIVSCQTLERHSEVLIEKMGDPQTVTVFTDIVLGAKYFLTTLGLPLEQVFDLPETYRACFPEADERTWSQIFAREAGRPLASAGIGSWDFHRDPGNVGLVLADSRAVVSLYTRMGRAVLDRGEEMEDTLYRTAKARIDVILATPDEELTPDTGLPQDPQQSAASHGTGGSGEPLDDATADTDGRPPLGREPTFGDATEHAHDGTLAALTDVAAPAPSVTHDSEEDGWTFPAQDAFSAGEYPEALTDTAHTTPAPGPAQPAAADASPGDALGAVSESLSLSPAPALRKGRATGPAESAAVGPRGGRSRRGRRTDAGQTSLFGPGHLSPLADSRYADPEDLRIDGGGVGALALPHDFFEPAKPRSSGDSAAGPSAGSDRATGRGHAGPGRRARRADDRQSQLDFDTDSGPRAADGHEQSGPARAHDDQDPDQGAPL